MPDSTHLTKQGDSLLSRLSGRPGAVASVFIACATVVPRDGRSYESWLSRKSTGDSPQRGT